MSYILDALKKAEAQRGNGQVPGLHDQHMPTDFGAPPEAPGNPLLIWIIMAMGVLLIGVLLWATWHPDEPARTEAQVPTSMPAVAPSPTAQVMPAPTPAPAPMQMQEPLPVPEAPAPEPVSRRNPPLQAAPAHAEATATATPAARQERQTAPRLTESSPDTTAPVEPAGKLPESMRGQIPKMNFGGAMHSDNPANRMLIINGQLFHEGDTVSPDLVLQEIQLKSATFRYRGYRHTVQF
ncbi:MAG TPA: general secretion pathway protein GspB [Aquabacterium sp.]|nr:general secretion pathway protein GspB [Aquabacterium sp.]